MTVEEGPQVQEQNNELGEEEGIAQSKQVDQIPETQLSILYNSSRPVEYLVDDIPIAPIVNCCAISSTAEEYTSQTWLAEEENQGTDSFNPRSIEINELPKRLANSVCMQRWNKAKKQATRLQEQLQMAQDEAVKQEIQEQIDAGAGDLASLESEVDELKKSFMTDQLSLVPWMCNLFLLADAGLRTFDTQLATFPYCDIFSTFSGADAGRQQEGAQKILGEFNKRYLQERSKREVTICTSFCPNTAEMGDPTQLVQQSVDGILERLQVSTIDLLYLQWPDFEEQTEKLYLTLQALHQLTQSEIDENGEEKSPKKINSIGLIDPNVRVIRNATQMGIQIKAIKVRFSLLDICPPDLLAECKLHNIKVVALGCTLGGLISSRFIGFQYPQCIEQDPTIESVGLAKQYVNKIGGWDRFQSMLTQINNIATRHEVSMQAVAIRWVIDQGAIPSVPLLWPQNGNQQFGYRSKAKYPTLGIDAQLFQKSSFLVYEDNMKLNELAP